MFRTHVGYADSSQQTRTPRMQGRAPEPSERLLVANFETVSPRKRLIPLAAFRSSVIRQPRSVRCLHSGTNADDATITAAANSSMGELLVPPPSGRLPSGRRVSLRSCRRFGGGLAHGADPLPDRSLTGRACLIVVQAFPIGQVWGGRQAQVLVRLVTE
jgi:hypothetical protein